jgi:hypothetical protein
MTEYGRELGRKLLGLVRRLAPSLALCGLSSAAVEAVLDKGDAIVGRPPRPARADSEAPVPETPHHNTPRGSVDGPASAAQVPPESPQTAPPETPDKIPGPAEVIHDKEHEIRLADGAKEGRDVLYSA